MMTEAWLREAEVAASTALAAPVSCDCNGLDLAALAQLRKCAENISPLVARVREQEKQGVELRRLLTIYGFVRGTCRECLQPMYLSPGDRCRPSCTIGAAMRPT